MGLPRLLILPNIPRRISLFSSNYLALSISSCAVPMTHTTAAAANTILRAMIIAAKPLAMVSNGPRRILDHICSKRAVGCDPPLNGEVLGGKLSARKGWK